MPCSVSTCLKNDTTTAETSQAQAQMETYIRYLKGKQYDQQDNHKL